MTIAFHDVLGLFRGFGNMVELYSLSRMKIAIVLEEEHTKI
jgi:hypothetical protein